MTAGEETTVLVENVYEQRLGGLVVFKQVRGGAAEFRGDIRVEIECTNGTSDVISAAPGTAAVPAVLTGVPVGTDCTITERLDGGAPLVDVVTAPGQPQVVTISASPTVARVTNTYTAEPGSLTVIKEVAGAAELRSGIVIDIACQSADRTFTVPVDASDTSSVVIDDLYPGETCTVTETDDGSNADVVAASAFTPSATVTIGPAADETVTVSNEYTSTAASPTSIDPEPLGGLPFTGTDSGALARAALVMLGAGAVVHAIRRHAQRGRPR